MILRDFEAHQDQLLPLLRRWHMPQYVALLGGLELEALSADELAEVLVNARSAMDRIEAGEASPEELEAALLGERCDGSGVHNMG
ncbi:MAG TPA: hypothetical protein VKQ70_13155 [Caulobacteraceae bacterium]|jgi:hypothetical protein|nr:hypothetical protein [Caulobacteraceae bacterium]